LPSRSRVVASSSRFSGDPSGTPEITSSRVFCSSWHQRRLVGLGRISGVQSCTPEILLESTRLLCSSSHQRRQVSHGIPVAERTLLTVAVGGDRLGLGRTVRYQRECPGRWVRAPGLARSGGADPASLSVAARHPRWPCRWRGCFGLHGVLRCRTPVPLAYPTRTPLLPHCYPTPRRVVSG
jgi:hypothetical protein